MNVFSKVLVVVVLLLSCGFVVSQMLLNSRREEWRVKYDATSSQLVTESKKARELGNELTVLRQDLGNLQTSSALEIKTLEDGAADKTRQIAALGRDKAAYQIEAERSGTQIASLMVTLEQNNTKIGGLQDRDHELHEQLTGALAKVEDLQTDVRDRLKQIDDKDDRIATLTRELRETSQDRDELHGELVRLQTMGINVAMLGDMVPIVDGRVVRASNEDGSMVINKGRNDNVKLGVAFAIYRGTTLIAKASVVDLQDTRCVVQVDRRLPYKPVEMGDMATTRF